MKRLLAGALVCVVAGLLYFELKNRREIAALQTQLASLTNRLTEKHPAPSIEIQEKCAAQSRQQFQTLGYKDDSLDSFVNHYNEKLGRCFVFITSTKINGSVSSGKYLLDLRT